MVPKPVTTAAAAAVAQNTFYKTERSLNKTQRAQQTARRKKHIPQALKWQTWIRYAGENFKAKCATPWCRNIMNVTNFQAGHRQAEAVGGLTTLENLIPICASCNQSMGTEHFDIWSRRGSPVRRCCFSLTNLWRLLRGQKTAYPHVTTTSSPLTDVVVAATESTSHQPHEQIPGWGGMEMPSSSQESDGGIQGDTYHPPPLQPVPPQPRTS
jgi:hypothetical protein